MSYRPRVNVKYTNDIESAILRISLGSRVISESWVNRDISLFSEILNYK
jgi:hypothetical protein